MNSEIWEEEKDEPAEYDFVTLKFMREELLKERWNENYIDQGINDMNVEF